MTSTVIPGESTEYNDPLDDVFGSGPPSPTREEGSAHEARHSEQHATDPSDIPRLRSTHITNGYREGIAVSKDKHLQDGFDEGYALGAEIGMRVGWCLGVLEGVLTAVVARSKGENVQLGEEDASGDSIPSPIPTVKHLRATLASARAELTTQAVFGEDYFGPDGIWLYQLAQHDDEDEVSFKEVADFHLLLKKWMATARGLANAVGLDINQETA